MGGVLIDCNAVPVNQRASGNLGNAVLRINRCQKTSGAINMSSKLKKEIRTMHWDDVGRSRDIFQFSVERLHLGGTGL